MLKITTSAKYLDVGYHQQQKKIVVFTVLEPRKIVVDQIWGCYSDYCIFFPLSSKVNSTVQRIATDKGELLQQHAEEVDQYERKLRALTDEVSLVALKTFTSLFIYP